MIVMAFLAGVIITVLLAYGFFCWFLWRCFA